MCVAGAPVDRKEYLQEEVGVIVFFITYYFVSFLFQLQFLNRQEHK